MIENSKFQAYSVERRAVSQDLSAKRYPLNAKILNILICSFAFCILHFDCYAQPTSSTELINNAKQFDGKTVVYEGEVIGDIMARGDFAWINVNDGKNAIGIWLNKELTKDIVHTGSYQVEGDAVEVVGIFSRACLEHGGDLDIHAVALHKISQGEQRQERLNFGKINLALWLLGALCIVLILRQLKLRPSLR